MGKLQVQPQRKGAGEAGAWEKTLGTRLGKNCFPGPLIINRSRKKYFALCDRFFPSGR